MKQQFKDQTGTFSNTQSTISNSQTSKKGARNDSHNFRDLVFGGVPDSTEKGSSFKMNQISKINNQSLRSNYCFLDESETDQSVTNLSNFQPQSSYIKQEVSQSPLKKNDIKDLIPKNGPIKVLEDQTLAQKLIENPSSVKRLENAKTFLEKNKINSTPQQKRGSSLGLQKVKQDSTNLPNIQNNKSQINQFKNKEENQTIEELMNSSKTSQFSKPKINKGIPPRNPTENQAKETKLQNIQTEEEDLKKQNSELQQLVRELQDKLANKTSELGKARQKLAKATLTKNEPNQDQDSKAVISEPKKQETENKEDEHNIDKLLETLTEEQLSKFLHRILQNEKLNGKTKLPWQQENNDRIGGDPTKGKTKKVYGLYERRLLFLKLQNLNMAARLQEAQDTIYIQRKSLRHAANTIADLQSFFKEKDQIQFRQAYDKLVSCSKWLKKQKESVFQEFQEDLAFVKEQELAQLKKTHKIGQADLPFGNQKQCALLEQKLARLHNNLLNFQKEKKIHSTDLYSLSDHVNQKMVEADDIKDQIVQTIDYLQMFYPQLNQSEKGQSIVVKSGLDALKKPRKEDLYKDNVEANFRWEESTAASSKFKDSSSKFSQPEWID